MKGSVVPIFRQVGDEFDGGLFFTVFKGDDVQAIKACVFVRLEDLDSPERVIVHVVGIFGMGGVDDVIGKAKSIGTVAGSHELKSCFRDALLSVEGSTTLFIGFVAITRAIQILQLSL